MSISSLEFLFLLLLVSAVFSYLPTAALRRFVFSLCSLAFISTYLPNSQSWIVLFGFLASGYACAAWLRARPSRLVFTAYMILLIATFAVLKKYDFLNFLVPKSSLALGVEIVGLSYMLFRQIHFMVDSSEGQIERPTLLSYLNFQLNPLTLLAGPIQRYQDFQAYWENPAPLALETHDALKVYRRLFIGIIKIVILSAAFRGGYDRLLGRLEQPLVPQSGGWKELGSLLAMSYCFMFYLYMNFSGYCDVVIAGGNLVGLRLPENFNGPLLARNILDYWSRWHITLGHWIRDYLFTPFYMAGAERFPSHTGAVAVAGYFVAFTIAGIWHGSSLNFLIYGLLHGLGASVSKIWEIAIVRYAGRPGLRKYLKSPTIRVAAVVATFHYVCLTLIFFALDVDRGGKIFARVFRSLISSY